MLPSGVVMPDWVESLQSQSSASLQREIAVELAQIIKQNYQAHLDRERMLTTLSALELQSSNSGSTQVKILAQSLNQKIKNLKPSTSSNSNNNNLSGEEKKIKDESNNNASEK